MEGSKLLKREVLTYRQQQLPVVAGRSAHVCCCPRGPRLPSRTTSRGLRSVLTASNAAGASPASVAIADAGGSNVQHHAQPVQHHAAFAAIGPAVTRLVMVGQPSALVRGLAARKWRGAGPLSLLLFLFGILLAILTAIRTVLVRRVKSCQCCRGYGIVRCRLCNGEGSVEWRGKNNHQETCPLCMTRRFVTCPECGGHYHKKMFIHIKPNVRGGVPDFLA